MFLVPRAKHKHKIKGRFLSALFFYGDNMNKKILLIVMCLFCVLSLTSCKKYTEYSKGAKDVENEPATEVSTTSPHLYVHTNGIDHGYMLIKYGKKGSQVKKGIPTMSLPLEIKSSPKNTVCYAITMIDTNSFYVCGYDWVHWLACNIDTKDIKENASIDLKDSMIQGENSFKTIGYGGPKPPDKTHTYKITIYALDSKLNLKNGYSLAEFNEQAEGRIIESLDIHAKYDN